MQADPAAGARGTGHERCCSWPAGGSALVVLMTPAVQAPPSGANLQLTCTHAGAEAGHASRAASPDAEASATCSKPAATAPCTDAALRHGLPYPVMRVRDACGCKQRA